MEPKVLANDAPDRTGRSGKLRWLPGLLVTLAVLAVLLVLGSTMSAQSAPASPMADPWATQFCLTYGMACATGDFNGDGFTDIVAFNRTVNTTTPLVTSAGDVWVMLSNGTSFQGPELWRTSFAKSSGEIPKVGDFNGDHLDDIIVFVRGNAGDAYVSLSTGYNFAPINDNAAWITGFCKSSELCDVGDFDGDGKVDIARFTRNVYVTASDDPNWGKVYVARSSGTSFSAYSYSWIQHFCMGPSIDGETLQYTEVCGVGDFNGDGLADVVAFSKIAGAVWVATNSGSLDFNDSSHWSPSDKAFCYGQEVCGVGDFNGDGRDDVITYLRSLYADKIGYVYVSLSNGSRFPKSDINLWSDYFCTGNEICGSGASMDGVSGYVQVSRSGDFNHDNHDDVVRFTRNTNSSIPGYVYVKLAYGNSFVDYVAPTNTPTPSQTPTATLTPTVTNTPTITPTPSNTPTPMPPLISR
jgi:hypothetical protein